MSGRVDEETPLLANGKKQATPLPWFQFSLVLFLQLAEPLTSTTIYPFAPELIRNIGITHGNEKKVGYYVGLMQSLFYLTQAFTILHWSRISDRIGRKPVVLIGLLGLSISMFCFGLSTTFWGLVLSRCLNGALNGNTGVIKSIVIEMTDTTNRAKAYGYMPIAFASGSTLGPLIGGMLARPAERFPDLFGENIFLKKYPYLLACAVPATFSLIAWLVTFTFLKETVPVPISIGRLLNLTADKKKPTLQNDIGSTDPSVATTSRQDENLDDDRPQAERPLPLRSLLTPRVLIAAGNYASAAFVDIAFRSTQPVFLSTPIVLGGLGLPPSTIGKLLSIQGISHGLFQVVFFARIHDRWGSKNTFIAGIASAIPVFFLFPIVNALARTQGYSLAVWLAVGLQILVGIAISLSYGAIFIFIAAAAPNRASIGATNGLSQVSVSIMRAIGPGAANSLFALSIEKGYLGGNLVYYVLILLISAALALGSFLPRRIWTN